MDDLFDGPAPARPPLAWRARPRSLDEVIGQPAIGAETPIGRRLRSGRIGSVVLYGPSGTGKTSIAAAVGATTSKAFRTIHPAEAGVAELRAIAAEARRTPLLAFLDEAQQFNSTSLGTLLGWVEQGLFDLILATTGNPYHVLPGALVSRSAIARIEPIAPADMELVVRRGVAILEREGTTVTLDDHQVATIAQRSGGDGRRAMNVLEDLSRLCEGGTAEVSDADIAACFVGSPVASDRKGDFHYDIASAFIKSMRNGDADATLYWLARMIHSGEDPRFIARRIMIQASEDVGLADNSALSSATAAHTAVSAVGYPEAEIILAHAALHVAMAPKSNSAYRGIKKALAHVRSQPPVRVPTYLRDAHYAGAAKLGHEGYRTPHSTEEGWVDDQDHAPGIVEGQFYESDARSTPTFESRANGHRERITGFPVPRRRFGD